jgi:hypothetical protein
MGQAKAVQDTIDALLPRINEIPNTQQRVAVLVLAVPLLNKAGKLATGKRLVEESGGHWGELRLAKPSTEITTITVQTGAEVYTTHPTSPTCHVEVSKQEPTTSAKELECDLAIEFALQDRKYHEARRRIAASCPTPDDHLRGLTQVLLHYLHSQNPNSAF